MDPRLIAAVRENASWCDLVCRTHGLTPAADGRVWHTARRSPPFYPDAITLDPAAGAAEVLAHIDTGPGCSVKDSFATLDLSPHGFRVLFEAIWIHRPPPAPGDPGPWRRLPAGDMPDDPSVAVLGDPDGPAGRDEAGRDEAGRDEAGRDEAERDEAERDEAGPGEAGRVVAHLDDGVVGLSNLVGDRWDHAVAAIAATFPGLPIVGYEAEVPTGFAPLGPLRVWVRNA